MKIKNPPPTQDRLKQVLDYNPETGHFYWKISTGPRVRVGDRAAVYKGQGYARVQIDGVRYNAHRLAWLYVYGIYPEILVDHINLDKSDNRIVNLRIATETENRRNTKTLENSKTGVKGVTYSTSCPGKYEARIGDKGKNYYLGVFETIEAAKEVLDKKRQEIHEEFANYE